jgi:hypothetical protein
MFTNTYKKYTMRTGQLDPKCKVLLYKNKVSSHRNHYDSLWNVFNYGCTKVCILNIDCFTFIMLLCMQTVLWYKANSYVLKHILFIYIK